MSRRVRYVFAALATLGCALGLAVGAAAPASAEVSSTPAPWTPQVTSPDATVRKMVQCGNTMFAVGQFTQITSSGVVYARNNAFSFDATTGAVRPWNPNVNGIVNSIAVSPDCSVAYLAASTRRSAP